MSKHRLWVALAGCPKPGPKSDSDIFYKETERFECWLEKFGEGEGLIAISTQVFPATDLESEIGSGFSAKRVDLNAAAGDSEHTSAPRTQKSSR
jgi:hypothetical protein